jgi:sugar phosphate permease
MLRNRRRWIVTSFVLVISAVAYVDRVNLSVAAPVLTKEFHTNAAVMGLLLSSFTWSYTLLNVPAGMLVDRIRTRFVYSGALLIWGAASFLTVLVNSVGALFGPRLLLGVGEAPFIPAGVRTLSDWLPRSERGAGGGLFISGVALGSAIGPPILATLLSGFGWRSCFIATGVLSIVVAIGWFAWYRHPDDDRKLSAEERELIRAGQEPDRPQGRAPWTSLIRNRDIWAITAGYFCLLYIQYTFVSWVPSYLVQDRHLTVLKSGLATSIPWTCAFLVAVLGGRISDVLMRRGWSALNARKVVLVGGMAAALAIVGTAFSASATSAIVFLSISTSGIVLANGAAWAATQDVTRRLNLPGSASGFINGVSNIGGILGPIVTGALVFATSSFEAPLLVSAGVALVGGLAWLLGIRARTEPATSAPQPRPIFANRRVALGTAVAVVGGLSAVGLITYPMLRASHASSSSVGEPGPAHASPQALPAPGQPGLSPIPDPVPWASPLDGQPLIGSMPNSTPTIPPARPATANLYGVPPAGPTGFRSDDGDGHDGDDGNDSDDDRHNGDGHHHDNDGHHDGDEHDGDGGHHGGGGWHGGGHDGGGHHGGGHSGGGDHGGGHHGGGGHGSGHGGGHGSGHHGGGHGR